MTELKLKVKKATVVTGRGTDKISIELEAPSPFPELGYAPYMAMDVKHKYGVEYCRTILGIEPEVIETEKQPSRGFSK